jgi:hypothetical protein
MLDLGLPGKADRAGEMADEEKCGHLRYTRVQSRVAEVGSVWCYVQDDLLKEGLQHGSESGLGQGGGGRVLALCGGVRRIRAKAVDPVCHSKNEASEGARWVS